VTVIVVIVAVTIVILIIIVVAIATTMPVFFGFFCRRIFRVAVFKQLDHFLLAPSSDLSVHLRSAGVIRRVFHILVFNLLGTGEVLLLFVVIFSRPFIVNLHL
jgi:hypothetical protein